MFSTVTIKYPIINIKYELSIALTAFKKKFSKSKSKPTKYVIKKCDKVPKITPNIDELNKKNLAPLLKDALLGSKIVIKPIFVIMYVTNNSKPELIVKIQFSLIFFSKKLDEERLFIIRSKAMTNCNETFSSSII